MKNPYSYDVTVRAVPLPSGTPNCFVVVAVPCVPLFFRTGNRDGYATGPDFQNSAARSRPSFGDRQLTVPSIPPHRPQALPATRRVGERGTG